MVDFDDAFEKYCESSPSISEGGRFSVGMILGEWRLTAYIGRGGMGEVYCAEHTYLGTPAAVKVLMREDEKSHKRFEREAKLLSELKSVLFPRFHSYGEANGVAYFAMELLEPGDLPKSEKAIVEFLEKVSEGIGELHAKGYIHRDIKPRNILWRSSDDARKRTPVVCDLGLVKKVSKNPSESSIHELSLTIGGVGTPGFGAPEQIERGEVTELSDIHALGVLADECFNGKAPWRWRHIIERATSSISRYRYSSVNAFVKAIHRALLLKYFIYFAVAFFTVSMVFPVVAFLSSPFSFSRFPSRLELKGGVIKLNEPVELKGGREYMVLGPGILDADISGPTNALLRLKDCYFLNRTKRLYPKNGLKYSLENGVYLNFTNFKESEIPLSLRLSDFLGRYDGAFNVIKFGGPETKEEVELMRFVPISE